MSNFPVYLGPCQLLRLLASLRTFYLNVSVWNKGNKISCITFSFFKMQANVFHKLLFSISLHYPKRKLLLVKRVSEKWGFFFLHENGKMIYVFSTANTVILNEILLKTKKKNIYNLHCISYESCTTF